MVRSRPTCWRIWKKSAGSRHGASFAIQNCSAAFTSEAARHGKKRSGNSASKTSASRLSAKSARANEVRRGHVRRVQVGRRRTGFGQSNSSPGSLRNGLREPMYFASSQRKILDDILAFFGGQAMHGQKNLFD